MIIHCIVCTVDAGDSDENSTLYAAIKVDSVQGSDTPVQEEEI